MKIENYKYRVYKYRKKLKVKIEYEIEDLDKWENDIPFIKRKLEYNEWMIEHLITYCPWDYSFNINLFASSIEATARNILEHGHFVGSEKIGRRALYAAKLLQNSYCADNVRDLSYDNHMSRSTTFAVLLKNGDGYEMKKKHLYKNAMSMDEKEYDTKMFNIIYKRRDLLDNNRWDFAWKYLMKHLRRFWD